MKSVYVGMGCKYLIDYTVTRGRFALLSLLFSLYAVWKSITLFHIALNNQFIMLYVHISYIIVTKNVFCSGGGN